MPPSSRKRTRLLAGCQACRISHRKCDTNVPCHSCQQSDLECIRNDSFRFQPPFSAAGGWDVVFPERALWPQTSASLRFCDQTSSIAEQYKADCCAPPGDTPLPLPDNPGPSGEEPPETSDGGEYPDSAPWPRAAVDTAYRELGSPGLSNHRRNGEYMSPVGVGESIERPSLLDASSTVPSSALQAYVPLQHREAILMRNFTENMASWVDVADVKRHFELEVPRRALYTPILRYAIFALSSRHLSRTMGEDETESLNYHNHALRLLISAVSASQKVNDEILASAVILRLFEEMEADDSQGHLSATTRLLNSLPDIDFFFSSGGLREATAWLCLRQDIYISLVTQQPLRTNLAKFLCSAVFAEDNHDDDGDFAWANRMVFLLARLLACAFCGTESLHNDNNGSSNNNNNNKSITSAETWRELDDEIEQWQLNRPASFDPIRFAQHSQEECHLPQIWMLSAVHVLAQQYYHVAKIVLVLSKQSATVFNAYENLQRGRSIERCVSHHLIAILGLAKSNPRAENALFTARHCLSVWGGVLRNRLDQAAAKEVLTTINVISGWSTEHLIDTLTAQWDEYQDEG
ncbi:hypothetical protein BJX65DRAFT_270904 [Aspergillus insuetus]